MSVTTENIQSALKVMVAAVEAIKDAGQIPSGHLYAAMMGTLSQSSYDAMLRQILRTGLVRQDGDVLIYVG